MKKLKKISNKNKAKIPLIVFSILIACFLGLLCYNFFTGKVHLKSDIHTTDAKTANVKQVIASKKTLKYKLDNGKTLYDDGKKNKGVFSYMKLSHNVIENKTQTTTIQPGDKIIYKIKHVKHNDQIFTYNQSLPENGDVYIITDVVSQ